MSITKAKGLGNTKILAGINSNSKQSVAMTMIENKTLLNFGKLSNRNPSSRLIYRLMLLAILIVFSSTSVVSAATSPQSRDALEHFFHQSFNNFEEEVEIAKEEGKIGIFVMFNDKDCPWCKKMKATVMSQVPVQEYFRKHFRIIHLDVSGDTTMVDFDGNEMAEKDYAFKVHRVRATPVFMVFDLEGKKILRYTGATRGAEEFLWMGEFIVNGHYKTEKFSKYKRAKLVSRDKN